MPSRASSKRADKKRTVFDFTGNLTRGKPSVSNAEVNSGVSCSFQWWQHISVLQRLGVAIRKHSHQNMSPSAKRSTSFRYPQTQAPLSPEKGVFRSWQPAASNRTCNRPSERPVHEHRMVERQQKEAAQHLWRKGNRTLKYDELVEPGQTLLYNVSCSQLQAVRTM